MKSNQYTHKAKVLEFVLCVFVAWVLVRVIPVVNHSIVFMKDDKREGRKAATQFDDKREGRKAVSW